LPADSGDDEGASITQGGQICRSGQPYGCLFEPIAVDTLGVLYFSANSLLKETGNKISLNTGESREVSFLHQRISVLLVQRFNAILLHDSLPSTDCTD